jgi:serine/threonine protein kinase
VPLRGSIYCDFARIHRSRFAVLLRCMGADDLPRMLSNRYRLERKLGHGGMGVVYGAVDTTMRRPVAIKLISPDPEVADEVVNRFMREAKNTARIKHPNIVHLFDIGRTAQGELYFVMELLEGVALSQYLRTELHIRIETAVHIARQICAGLGLAHESGIIHRDLKPANVMLMRTPEDSHFVKVLDFGVSKAQNQATQITKTGMLVGTVEYMPPEQIRGHTVDARTDIYALGVILYRMLSGGTLFADASAAVVIQQHMKSMPPPLRQKVPERSIPLALDALVMRCLAKNADSRFASMADLDDALLRCLSEEETNSGWDPTFVDTGGNATKKALERERDARPVLARLHDGDEFDESTRVEGRKSGTPGSGGISAPPHHPHPQLEALDDTEFMAPATLVMPNSGRVTQPELLQARARSAASTVQGMRVKSAQKLPGIRVLPLSVVFAATIVSAAVAFAVIRKFAQETLIILGGALIVAALVLLLGVRRNPNANANAKGSNADE